ncbi:platelet endothelial aggregation receptor 1-like [Cimex lectularius]|uniref:Chitin-binding type-2 domain-containing protein n=1 Tax=Cimex lectularius TaxID=79782 RepID=A0A8I6SQS7_CIMLE|nr:platelet endothelial aggregation receptor 1-like [Cimex lectularius]
MQVSSTLCIANCTLGPDNVPDCSMSRDGCCSPNTIACSHFFTCSHGRLLSATCPPGHGFHESSLRCKRGHRCYTDCPKRCTNSSCTETCCSPHPYNCKYYHSCNGDRFSLGQCPEGYNFDEYGLACVEGYQCYQDEPAPCPKFCTSSSCNEDCCGPSSSCGVGYIVCRNGILTRMSCSQNTMFNLKTFECDEETFSKCFTEGGDFVQQTTEQAKILEGRRLLSKEEFLSAIYSVYKIVGEKFTAEIN